MEFHIASAVDRVVIVLADVAKEKEKVDSGFWSFDGYLYEPGVGFPVVRHWEGAQVGAGALEEAHPIREWHSRL